MFGILLDDGQDAGGYNAMRLAEIAVDLLKGQSNGLLKLLQLLRQRQIPLCRLSRHSRFANSAAFTKTCAEVCRYGGRVQTREVI